MDNVEEVKKAVKKMENPLEKSRKLPKFAENYEEELIKSLFEERAKSLSQRMEFAEVQEYSGPFVHHERPGEEWDVPITEEIKYFDSELSYELTGYRPITMEKGLDFDPEPFREMAILYESSGAYTKAPPKSKPDRDLWNREMERMRNGLTIGKYRITGDNYYYLNYYRMEVMDETSVAGAGRHYEFPKFLSKQYEWFHYIEMAKKLHKDAIALKGRGIGWSEMTAAMSVRPYTTTPEYRVVLTAADDQKLGSLKQKCWYQLDWLNMNTNGGLRHVRQKTNNNDTKRASKVTKDGHEFGWQSEIHTIIADKPSKIRGDRTDILVLEEAGSNVNFTASWIQGNSLVELGGHHFGFRVGLGTGGDIMALEGLADAFRDPWAYNVLPFKNYDTFDGKPELTCFFVPSHKFALVSKYLDSRGVTNYIEFKKYYEVYRNTLSGQKLLDECAEHCFIPEEALSKTGENMFDSELVSTRLTQILTSNDFRKPKPISLLWEKTTGKKERVYAVDNPNSKLLISEPPLVDEDGTPYKNLYVAGIDSIDMGTENSANDTDVSDFCIVIKKRIFGSSDPKYVAVYKDRPRDIRTAYETALKLLTWYNCRAMLEFTKISIQEYFIIKINSLKIKMQSV